MNGANLLVAAVENEGAKQIFGVPGAVNLDLAAARRRLKIELAVAAMNRSQPSWQPLMGG